MARTIQSFPTVRRIPRQTQTVTLEAPGAYYDGWQVTFRTNPPWSVLTAPEQQDPARLPQWLAQLIVEWDFVDEDGRPLPPTADGIAQLPAVLMAALTDAWRRVCEVPKASSLE